MSAEDAWGGRILEKKIFNEFRGKKMDKASTGGSNAELGNKSVSLGGT
jgi:hypothetical protein